MTTNDILWSRDPIYVNQNAHCRKSYTRWIPVSKTSGHEQHDILSVKSNSVFKHNGSWQAFQKSTDGAEGLCHSERDHSANSHLTFPSSCLAEMNYTSLICPHWSMQTKLPKCYMLNDLFISLLTPGTAYTFHCISPSLTFSLYPWPPFLTPSVIWNNLRASLHSIHQSRKKQALTLIKKIPSVPCRGKRSERE